ncbi:MAG: hypothetical protein HYX60_12225 [Legionella longbeachae]|nr:hypothetical protein [Legionella longbeachae]
MENKVKFQQKLLSHYKRLLSKTSVMRQGQSRIILSIILLLPMASYAHLLSITATKPFPSTIPAGSSIFATFKVTNISSKANVTAIDQSNFPKESGLSISSSTCGTLLTPGQFCVIQVALQAPTKEQIISTALREWAKPSAEGVQYPIKIKVISAPELPAISLVQIPTNVSLPALRAPAIAQSSGNWLIVSGTTGNFHDFNNNSFNTSIYVYDPVTTQIYSVDIGSTDLDPEIKKQLASSSPQFLQDGDTLYLIGGFYTADNQIWTTLNTITAINVPNMINAIISGQTNLNQYAYFRTDIPQFQVTGGQLGKIGNYFYLAYGQNCEGSNYCTKQTYTNSIYKFITDPTLISTQIVSSASHLDKDGSGWRRRDYNLAPFKLGDSDTLFAMAGPFTPGDNALVWTNGIMFDSKLKANDNFINQQANQYAAASLSMYSENNKIAYVATFSGLSNLYWTTTGLVNDNTTPYGNILDLISSDNRGNVQEFANLQPVCSTGTSLQNCLYMGLSATFIPIANYYDNRFILQLDQLPKNTSTLIGYIFGGLLSPVQTIFELPSDSGSGPSYASNQIYAVYVTPSAPIAGNWESITNLYPGT